MTASAGFEMASDVKTGRLLALLAASRPAGRILEIGTVTGISASWLLSGMTVDAELHSVEVDKDYSAIAQHNLGADRRLRQITCDAIPYLQSSDDGNFDLIFADTWPGKFTH